MDASVLKDSASCGYENILRNHLREVIDAQSTFFYLLLDVEAAEVCAIKEGLQVGLEGVRRRLEVSGDCSVVISTLNYDISLFNDLGAIFNDVKDFATIVANIRFKLVPKNLNKLAHFLAKWTSMNTCPKVLCEYLPILLFLILRLIDLML